MRARVTFSKEFSTLGTAVTMRFLMLSACLAVTRAENVAMTSSGTAVFIATGGEVYAYVTSDAGDLITFTDLPDPLPDHNNNDDFTGDDANATDDENVTGFPPVDDLTDGARGWRAGFAAAACAVAHAF